MTPWCCPHATATVTSVSTTVGCCWVVVHSKCVLQTWPARACNCGITRSYCNCCVCGTGACDNCVAQESREWSHWRAKRAPYIGAVLQYSSWPESHSRHLGANTLVMVAVQKHGIWVTSHPAQCN